MRERKLEKDLEKKEKKKKISRGERRGLTGHCGQTPWRATSPSAQTLKKLIHHFLIWGDSCRLHLRLPGPKSSPLCPQSLSNCCLSLKKIKSFLNKGAFKADAYTRCRACSLEKTPWGGVSPRLREKPNGEGI